ncbi:glycosyltransferase family 4 protein [Isoptericola sp. 4D.3]|uniref:Glycosyltransferase family 4 protein n=1 Tax=Isoptericola peretonis TaxID=2918523 RepID=A0ABT0J5T1_9MICO|nr:glycosyltransferase family 4 protein [Isoptericola sp. 4D.3]
MRIAMVSYYLPSASKQGIGYQVHELATELVRRGHQVDVISDCPPVPGAVYGHRHVELAGALRTFRFATAVRRLDLSGYDVLHAHGDDYWLWRRRVPRHVRTLHGSCFEEARRIRGAKERLRMVLLGCSELLASVVADRTVVVSPATRRWYPWVHDVVPNGVDTTRFAPGRTGARADHPVVLFVGAWHGRKNGAELARQFVRDVRPRHPAAELWMVSRDVPDDPGPGVRALGALDDAALAEAYRRAWAFCLPSDYEGFGIPYVEAMASGLPVVATPNVGARYVTDEGRAGALVPLEGVGAALADLLDDGVRRAALVDAGLARSRDFSLERVVDRYEELYRPTAPAPAPARAR